MKRSPVLGNSSPILSQESLASGPDWRPKAHCKKTASRSTGTEIERTSGLPRFGAYRVLSDGATEVDEQQLERGRADDAIVQFGIAVCEPPFLQSHELSKRLFGEEPQAGRRRERKFLGQADVGLGGLDAEGGDAGVGLPREEAAAENGRGAADGRGDSE